MRGCLFVLLAAAIVVSAAAWFGAPVLASAVVDSGLRDAGFEAAALDSTVSADPPPRILLGHADAVRIEAAGVSFRTFRAERLDLTLTDVDLIGRSFATIRGTIGGAELTTPDDVATTADVAIHGGASDAAAEIAVDGTTVDRVVRATLEREFHVVITRTALVAPDTLRIVAPGATLEGRMVVDASGAIALATRLGDTRILELDPSFPLRLASVAVSGGDLRIAGTLDAAALLGR